MTAPILLVTTDAEWIRLGIMALTTTTAAVLVTFVTPRTDERVLAAFYLRVQPPGFWRGTARTARTEPGAALERLRHGLIAALTCAVSLFLTLYGCGAMLVRSPGRPALVPIAAVLAGLALTPLWWRMLRSENGRGLDTGTIA
ncbi:MAG TPA: hypothetical protein VHG09_03700 [Longimicrobiales bacterium]|nr:hypothetical protein [Longimicrobiales bacterium]